MIYEQEQIKPLIEDDNNFYKIKVISEYHETKFLNISKGQLIELYNSFI